MNKPQSEFLSIVTIWLLIVEAPTIYLIGWKFAAINTLTFMTFLCIGMYLSMRNHERN